MTAAEVQIGNLAVRGLLWSVVKNWGGRIVTFLLFIVLARLLSPAQFGLASAALMLVLFIGQLAEFGFGDAIVQRRNFSAADANLPFIVSTAVATGLSVGCAIWAKEIESWLGTPGLAPIIIALCALSPLTTISLFQEANFRRNCAFRVLAIRVLLANLVAGIAAISSALLGFGVWALVVQSYVSTVVGLVWLWSRPAWRPSLKLELDASFALARFGLPGAAMRVLDFGASRYFEVILLARYGVAVYGLYSAGSRLYLTLTQLLQSALNDVSLTILSRVAHDRSRIGHIYLQTIVMATLVFVPLFVGCAAVISEISSVLFGARWAGVDAVAKPLLLLGAVQSVQFLNGPYLSARGRPGLVLVISSLKNIAIVLSVTLIAVDDLVRFVEVYALAQLIYSPIAFGALLREFGIPLGRFIRSVLPGVIGACVAYFLVGWMRPLLLPHVSSTLAIGLLLGLTFVASFGIVILAVGRPQLEIALSFARKRIQKSSAV